MLKRTLLWTVSGAIALAALLALLWLLRAGGGSVMQLPTKTATGSNPTLDVRFAYDPAVLRLGPYVPNAELPLLLEGVVDNQIVWIFGGKRISGVASLLAKAPGPMLYDFVGSENDAAFRELYHLTPQGEPQYEDAHFNEQLALHTVQVYSRTAPNASWPQWFPDSVKSGTLAHVEGWALFSPEDLFFFYAVSPRALSEAERRACEQVLESLQFGAVLGTGGAGLPEAQPDATEEGAAAPQPPPAGAGSKEAPVLPPSGGRGITN